MAIKTVDKYQPKKYLGRGRKETLVAEYSDKVGKATGGMIFADYQGLTHQQLEQLKRSVKKLDAEFVATKNTLLLRALEPIKLSDDAKEHFNNPTATLFAYGDSIEPLKVLAKMIKETELPKIKFGYVDGAELTESDIIKLSKLPGLETLRAQLVGTLNSPMAGLHRALHWNLQKLAMTLQAIADSKPNAAPATPEPVEVKTEAPTEPQEEVKTEESTESTEEAVAEETKPEENKEEQPASTN